MNAFLLILAGLIAAIFTRQTINHDQVQTYILYILLIGQVFKAVNIYYDNQSKD